MDNQRAELPGSAVKEHPGDEWIGPADPRQEITVTILLRRPGSAADIGEALLSGTYERQSREATEAALAADPKDIEAVQTFAGHYGLAVVGEDRASRVIRVRGTVPQLEAAFGVKIGLVRDPSGDLYLSYRGAITVPESIALAVTAVLGLDQRPVAKRHGAGSWRDQSAIALIVLFSPPFHNSARKPAKITPVSPFSRRLFQFSRFTATLNLCHSRTH